jgi:competence protein ComEA
MDDIPKQQLVLWALAIVAVGLIGARYLADRGDRPGGAAPARAAVHVFRSGSGGAYVHVAGAVRRPGVYRISSAARLDAAIRRAGGATAKADLEAVNLAAHVADGQQVIVPRRVPGAGSGAVAGGAAAAGSAGAPVSLNTATAEQLDQLEGVGPATAQKILDWRQEHGGFSSVDQLKQISGIGPKRFEALRDSVRM